MMLSITREHQQLLVRTPYHPAFPGRARLLEGRWQGDAWVFPYNREEEVRRLCLDIYGDDGTAASTAQLVRIRVEVTVPCRGGPFEQVGTALYLGGREIAHAFRVGARARPGEGVTFIRRAPCRAGSDEFPITSVPHGAIFEVTDMPRHAAEKLREEVGAYGKVLILDGTL
jgi:hypothetical protein